MEIIRKPPFSSAGKALNAANDARMNGGTLLATVLVVGGALYLSIFLWITRERLKEIGPPKPPGGH